jgi:hypothetical protein
MPKGLIIAGTGTGRLRFRLYDTRKRFAPPAESKPERGPRIHFFHDRGPLVPASPAKQRKPNSANLLKRCEALRCALENLPREARRMALWLLRREAKSNTKFKSPLRPGPPPGHQKRPRFTIDRVLAICHGLAFEALFGNSS